MPDGFSRSSLSTVLGRSVQVLLSHLVWVFMGIRILGLAMRPFFNREKASFCFLFFLAVVVVCILCASSSEDGERDGTDGRGGEGYSYFACLRC